MPAGRGGPSARPASTRLRERSGFVLPLLAERLPLRSSANPVGRPTGIARRRALLGLGGATAAGLGFAGWKIGDGGSSTREPDSDPTLTAPSGEQRWRFATGGSVSSSTAVADGAV
ncbi:hypothetical protein ACTWQR_31465 [Streptomyces sp. 2A115]